jgi:hypothetical protein
MSVSLCLEVAKYRGIAPENDTAVDSFLEELIVRREVGRCRLTVSKPALKARMVSALEATI